MYQLNVYTVNIINPTYFKKRNIYEQIYKTTNL